MSLWNGSIEDPRWFFVGTTAVYTGYRLNVGGGE